MCNNRKKRAMPDDLASPETVSAWGEVSSNTLHKTNPKGITCLDLHPSNPNLVSENPNPNNANHAGHTPAAGPAAANLTGCKTRMGRESVFIQ